VRLRFIAYALCVWSLYAQDYRAKVQGVVTDSSDAIIAGAKQETPEVLAVGCEHRTYDEFGDGSGQEWLVCRVTRRLEPGEARPGRVMHLDLGLEALPRLADLPRHVVARTDRNRRLLMRR